jgi:shikimate dehydrogenase
VVFGHPIAHSLSPRIHLRFAEQAGRAIRYELKDAPTEHFAELLQQFEANGGYGASITLPNKRLAFDLCKEVSDVAGRIRAVNTVTRLRSGGFRGDNTDGIGLLRDLAEHQRMDIRGRRTLLLGAGGSASAVAYALLDAGIADLTICNRTPERADALADQIGDPDRVHTRYWSDLADCGSFDLIINATAAGHNPEAFHLPFSIVGNRAMCYDLSYGTAAQKFLSWARSANAGYVFDGLGMLVEQAAEAFALWHGIRPDTAPVYQELRAELGSS